MDARGSVALHERLIDLCAAGDGDGAAAVSTQTWQTLTPLLKSGALDPAQTGHP